MSRASSPYTMFRLLLSVTRRRHISFLSRQRQFDNDRAVLIRKRERGEASPVRENDSHIRGQNREERVSELLSRRSGPFIFLRSVRELAIIRVRVKSF